MEEIRSFETRGAIGQLFGIDRWRSESTRALVDGVVVGNPELPPGEPSRKMVLSSGCDQMAKSKGFNLGSWMNRERLRH